MICSVQWGSRVGTPQREAPELKMHAALGGMGGRQRALVALRALAIRMVRGGRALPVLCLLLWPLSLCSPVCRGPLLRETVSEADKPSSVPGWLCDRDQVMELAVLHFLYVLNDNAV